MNTLALSLALLTGLDAATPKVGREMLLAGAVELSLPQRQWAEEVGREARRLGLGCAVVDRYTAAYPTLVAERLRRKELGSWSDQELAYFCSGGVVGKRQCPGWIVALNWEVMGIGSDLSAALKDEVGR